MGCIRTSWVKQLRGQLSFCALLISFALAFFPQFALAGPTVEIKDHTVEYLGRNYNANQNTTEFSYKVCRGFVFPGASRFVMGFPQCAQPLTVTDTTPNANGTGVDSHTGVYGVRWNKDVNLFQCKTFKAKFAGEVGEGIVNVGLKAGSSQTNTVAQLPGASCYSSGELCDVGNNSRIVVMIDRTGSLSDLNLETEKAAARTLITNFADVSPRPKIAIGTFNVQSGPDARIEAGLTSNYGGQNPSTGLYAAVEGITGTHGNTDIQKAIDTAANHLASVANPNGDPNFIVLISDGVPNRPGSPQYSSCNSCGCVSAYNAGSTAATNAEGAPVNAKIFAIHYEGTGFACPGEPANGIAYLRDQIASDNQCFYQGNSDLTGVFQQIADQVVCNDDDACRVFRCEGQGCVSESIIPNDPSATEGGACTLENLQGVCRDGVYDNNCECSQVVFPGTEQCFNQLDDDCDGLVDENDPDCWECQPGQTEQQACSSGLPGVCDPGMQERTCVNGFWGNWGQCDSTINPGEYLEGPPGDPSCSDQMDNDCDGDTDIDDEGCRECDPGETDTMACVTQFPGVCEPGTKERTCGANALWGAFGACVPDVDPATVANTELIANQNCGDQTDNDCDGLTDNLDPGCFECTPGAQESRACDTQLEGICAAGEETRLCVNGFWDDWSQCAVLIQPGAQEESPAAQTCGDDLDNDCDGLTDEFDPDCFECDPGLVETEACNDTGVPGICANGERSRTCVDGFWEDFGACEQTVQPEEEICDQIDNDCDGAIDEDFNVGDSCTIEGVGVCQTGGITQCAEDGTAECVPSEESEVLTVTSTDEVCDGLDNDCDGLADEINVCLACEDVDITSSQFTVDGNLSAMAKLTRRIANKIKKAARGKKGFKKQKLYANQLRDEAQALADEGWTKVWSLPNVQSDCANPMDFCVTVSNVATIDSFVGLSEQLRDLMKSGVKRLRKVSGKARSGKRYNKDANRLHDENLETAAQIPTQASSCDLPA